MQQDSQSRFNRLGWWLATVVALIATGPSIASASLYIETGASSRTLRQAFVGNFPPSVANIDESTTSGAVARTAVIGLPTIIAGANGSGANATQSTQLNLATTSSGQSVTLQGSGIAQARANGTFGGIDRHASAQSGVWVEVTVTDTTADYSFSANLATWTDRTGGSNGYGGSAALEVMEVAELFTLGVSEQIELSSTPTFHSLSGTLFPGQYLFSIIARTDVSSSTLAPASAGVQNFVSSFSGLNLTVTQSVPEPATLGTLGAGALGLLARRRRNRL